MENDDVVGAPGEQTNDPPGSGVVHRQPEPEPLIDSPHPHEQPQVRVDPPWFPGGPGLWPSGEHPALPEKIYSSIRRWREPPRVNELDPAVVKTARDTSRLLDPRDVVPLPEELLNPCLESDGIPTDPFIPLPPGAVFVHVPFRDDPPAPPTPFARTANTCSRMLDAVVEVERLEATQAAWKAEFVDRACTLALVNEEGVIAGSKDVLQRREMALRCFISELACALRIPERTAGILVEESRVLVHRLPLTMNALRAGEISYRHAQQLVDQIATLADEAAADLERRVLSFATTMTVAQFRQKTRIMRERLVPESAVQRCVKSVRDRRVEILPAPDGMAWVNLFTTAPLAETIFDAIRAQSMRLQSPAEPRTLAQLDADIVVDGLLGGCQIVCVRGGGGL